MGKNELRELRRQAEQAIANTQRMAAIGGPIGDWARRHSQGHHVRRGTAGGQAGRPQRLGQCAYNAVTRNQQFPSALTVIAPMRNTTPTTARRPTSMRRCWRTGWATSGLSMATSWDPIQIAKSRADLALDMATTAVPGQGCAISTRITPMKCTLEAIANAPPRRSRMLD